MDSLSVKGPYEEAAISLIRLIDKVIEGQPPEVKADLWRMYVDDVKEWRAFWSRLKP
jgi:hypothetical protein